MRRTLHSHLATLVCGLVLLATTSASAQTPPSDADQQHQHDQHQPAAPEESSAVDRKRQLPPFIPPVTDSERRAAFPDVKGHAVHDKMIRSLVLFDQLEWRAGDGSNGPSVDTRGWVGRDRDRLWFRAEGDRSGGRVDDAQADVMYGRQFSRWWDVVAGLHQDFRPGAAQTWAAVGVQGLAPHWFDVEATGYIGASGRTHARLEVEYEVLVTNRLILQSLLEAEIVGKSDPKRRVGAGLSKTDVGFRVRYEFRREAAPYIGFSWSNKWGKTADFASAAGEDAGGARLVTGLRVWF